MLNICLNIKKIIPEFCTRYYSEAQEALSLKGGWSNFVSQAYCLYGENQNCETAFKDKVLQATVDGWCKIQVIISPLEHTDIIWSKK